MNSHELPQRVNRYRVEAVDRAIVLLNALAARPGVNASEIAAALGMNRSLTFRVLSTLVDRGYAVKDAGNLYWLGPELIKLSYQPNGNNVWALATQDVLDDFLNETQETVAITARDQLEGVTITYRESPQQLRFHAATTPHRGPLYTGASLRTLLAYAPQDVIDEIIARHLPDFAPRGYKDMDQALSHLAQIRKDGFYASIGEIEPDVFSISAPIRSQQLGVVGVIAVLGPLSRLNDERQASLVRSLIDASEKIGSRLR